MRLSGTLAAILLIGCGGTSVSSGDDQPPDDGGTTTGDASVWEPPAGYTKLIGRTWTLPVGARDQYKCVRVTIPQDTYITNIVAQAPNGTHHTVVSFAGINGTSGADGEQDCNVGTIGMEMLYASGVGTSPLDFPAGVGLEVTAGQQVHLNLHLYNGSDEAISGESAIWVKSSPTPPPTLAEMVFAGTFNVIIPSNNQPTNISGGCTVPSDYNLFAVWPHMHKSATHQKVELIRNNTPTVLHDDAYNFAEQTYYEQDPIVAVQAGDQVRVTCTYVNNTGATITWGDSSDKEMCFAGLYRYPAKNAGLFDCTEGGGL